MNAEVDRGLFPFVVVFVFFLARTRALVPETLITGLFNQTGSGRKLVSGKEAVLLTDKIKQKRTSSSVISPELS